MPSRRTALTLVIVLTAAGGCMAVVRAQTAELGGVGRINDSGVRVLHAARALRKVAVGK